MLPNRSQPGTAVVSVSLTVAIGFFALFPIPCSADVAPESGLLAHVQAVSGSCATLITDCHQITRTASADGQVEFLLFFMRGAYSWPGETICIWSIDNELTWPETWQLVEFEPCGSWPDGWLVPNGATHALHLEWMYEFFPISDEPGGVVPVARLVMNVGGPGRLDVVGRAGQNPITLRHNCSDTTFVTYPAQVGAEAGLSCGYLSAHCGYREDACQAVFEVPELALTVPAGARADSTVGFWAVAWYNPDQLCPQSVESQAPWCTGWIDPLYEFGHADLHVTADADGLEPGDYETDLMLRSDSWGNARCLPIVFTVVAVPADVDEAPQTMTASWGRLKSLYR